MKQEKCIFITKLRKEEEVIIYISGAFRNEKTRDQRSQRYIYKNKLLEGNKLFVKFMFYEESLTRY